MDIKCPHCSRTIHSVPNTEMQKRVLEYVVGFVETKGHSPSIAQIGRHFNVGKSTAHKHIRSLRRQGFLHHTPRPDQSAGENQNENE